HPGARSISEWMREDAEYAGRSPGAGAHAPELLRAAGQALGVQLDAAAFAERCLQVELNSVSDDPIVHPGSGELLLGGNFYGGATTLALDAMKSAVFGAASYLERVLALVCDPRRNGGLPQDLADPNHAPAQGFRAMRGVVGGLLNDAVMLAAPSGLQAGLGSRDSELASAGTQAARRCLDVLELAESIAAIAALALCQAVDLRDGRGCHRRSKAIYGAVRQLVPRLQEDRAQDRDITSVLELFRAGLLPVGQSA
ncbi:MAG: aromatic amino acid lyase, partial [Myxococcota bacterium]